MINKYTNLREVSPKEMQCGIGACPSAYEATREGREIYLIVGTQVNPSEAGLENKVGEGEALVEIPRVLIGKKDNSP